MFLIMLWSPIALQPLLQCTTCPTCTCVATPRGWSTPVVVGYHSLPVTLMSAAGKCVGGLVTIHGRTASCWCGSHYSQQRLHPHCSVERLMVNSHGVAQKTVYIIVSMNGSVKWSTHQRWWEWFVCWQPREVTSISKCRPVLRWKSPAVKTPLSVRWPQHSRKTKPLNRNRGFLLKTNRNRPISASVKP